LFVQKLWKLTSTSAAKILPLVEMTTMISIGSRTADSEHDEGPNRIRRVDVHFLIKNYSPCGELTVDKFKELVHLR
jgi:hypothetical protein